MKKTPARINYKHLQYFQQVARDGSVTAAARRLHVAPQTVSAQLMTLERTLGRALFDRVGRRLLLTPDGRVALDYANSIFDLGLELRSVLAGQAQPRRLPLRIGITDGVPKLLAVRALAPVLERHRDRLELRSVLAGQAQPRSLPLRIGITDGVPKLLAVRALAPMLERHRDRLELVCEEGRADELFGRLAAHRLDAVLAEQPVPPHLARAMRGRPLVESGVSFVAVRTLAAGLRAGFPGSLSGARLINWSADSPLGSGIDAWLADRGLNPRVVARCDDSALMKVLAQRGLGVACVPTAIEDEVLRQYGLAVVGRAPELAEPLFLVEPSRRQANPLLAEVRPLVPSPRRALRRR